MTAFEETKAHLAKCAKRDATEEFIPEFLPPNADKVLGVTGWFDGFPDEEQFVAVTEKGEPVALWWGGDWNQRGGVNQPLGF